MLSVFDNLSSKSPATRRPLSSILVPCPCHRPHIDLDENQNGGEPAPSPHESSQQKKKNVKQNREIPFSLSVGTLTRSLCLLLSLKSSMSLTIFSSPHQQQTDPRSPSIPLSRILLYQTLANPQIRRKKKVLPRRRIWMPLACEPFSSVKPQRRSSSSFPPPTSPRSSSSLPPPTSPRSSLLLTSSLKPSLSRPSVSLSLTRLPLLEEPQQSQLKNRKDSRAAPEEQKKKGIPVPSKPPFLADQLRYVQPPATPLPWCSFIDEAPSLKAGPGSRPRQRTVHRPFSNPNHQQDPVSEERIVNCSQVFCPFFFLLFSIYI